MDDKKAINKKKLIIVAVLSSFIFFTGFIISSELSRSQMSELSNMEEEIKLDVLSLETEYELALDQPCQFIQLETLNKKLDELGTKLSFMEFKVSEDDAEFENLKKYYSALEIKHWLFTRKVQEECGSDMIAIAYFYSSKDCADCASQGRVLTYLKTDNPNIMVYSFDLALDFGALNTFKKVYGINSAPSMIINDKTYTGLINSEDLSELMY